MKNKYKDLQATINDLRVNFPKEFAKDAVEELFSRRKEIHIYGDELGFNKTTGVFRVGKKSARFGKKSKHYKLIHLLWENPNRMFDYAEIAFHLWNNANKLDAISRLRQIVYEIKERVGLTESDQTVFVCNDGYMLQR